MIAGSPSPVKEGAVGDPTQQPHASWGFEVWYQPSTPSTGVTPEFSATPLLSASSVPQQQKPTSATVPPTESLPVSLLPAPPATAASPNSSPAPPPTVSEVPVQQQQQQQPGVSPAATRSVSRQQGGLGMQSSADIGQIGSEGLWTAGVDYFETYSACPSVARIRLLAAFACELGLDVC